MIAEDSPLTQICDDKLGREPIVELIVDSINHVVSSDHECIVYGVYGKWGGRENLAYELHQRASLKTRQDRRN